MSEQLRKKLQNIECLRIGEKGRIWPPVFFDWRQGNIGNQQQAVVIKAIEESQRRPTTEKYSPINEARLRRILKNQPVNALSKACRFIATNAISIATSTFKNANKNEDNACAVASEYREQIGTDILSHMVYIRPDKQNDKLLAAMLLSGLYVVDHRGVPGMSSSGPGFKLHALEKINIAYNKVNKILQQIQCVQRTLVNIKEVENAPESHVYLINRGYNKPPHRITVSDVVAQVVYGSIGVTAANKNYHTWLEPELVYRLAVYMHQGVIVTERERGAKRYRLIPAKDILGHVVEQTTAWKSF